MNVKTTAFSRISRHGAVLFLLLVLIVSAGCNTLSSTPVVVTPALPAAVNTAAEAAMQVTPALAQVLTLPAETPLPQATQAAPNSSPTADISAERAQALPDPSTAVWKEFATGLSNPVDMAAPMDGSGRLLVVERTGKVQLLVNGQIQAEPFLDISSLITTSGLEQGLLGLALHSDYNNNGYFYVNYTDTNGDTVIARYTRSADPNKADPTSEQVLIRQDQPYPNHNGGSVRFGPDGYLYLGLGDGGAAGDPNGNAQNPNELLGKILRIDVNQGEGYGIPSGNLYQAGQGRSEVYAMGLRNPWRFSFDPGTGDLYIGDVGQNNWEEIDILVGASDKTRNFGWDYLEGTHPYEGEPPQGQSLTGPVFEYDHSQGCSVTGGVVYNGQLLPDWKGVYLFADYCSGNVWGLLNAPGGVQSTLLYESGSSVSSFGEDQNGEVYMLDLNGRIYRLEPAE